MANVVQLSVDDTSPTIVYAPFGDTFGSPNLTAGWNPYFDSGFNAFPGQVGNGTSSHITSLDGAALSITWQGTGIQLLGNVTQADFSLVLDGAPINFKRLTDRNLLFSISNLTNMVHVLVLKTQISQDLDNPPQSMVVFDRAIISSPPPANSSQNSFTPQTLNDSNVNFRGQWSFENQDSSGFHKSTTKGDQAHSSFLGTVFLIQGTTSPDGGNYSVQLDDGVRQNFSAKSSFTKNDSLLFYASGLDPTQVHQWDITNEDGSALILPLGGFTSFADGDPNPPPPPSSPTSSPTASPTQTSGVSYSSGTIAALALAGILAFILLSGFLFFFLIFRPRRRRLRRERQERRRKKLQEAGVVFDIAPERPDIVPESKRTSRRTGFARWKHEVEGGALGLSDLGLSFRRSDSEEKLTVESEEYDDEVPRSAKSFRFTPSLTSFNGNRQGRSRWFGSRRSRRSSPSFALDLPPILPHSNLRSESHPALQDASSGLTSLSYLSSSNNSAPKPNHSDPNSTSTGSHVHPGALQTTASLDTRSARSGRSAMDSDFGSVQEFDDGTSVLGAAAARAAIRGLSPRTSEVGSRSGSRADDVSQHLVMVSGWQNPPDQPRGKKTPSPSHERGIGPVQEQASFLDVGGAQSSELPRQAGGGTSATRPRRLSSLSHVRFEDSETNTADTERESPKDKLAVPSRAPFRLTPTTVLSPAMSSTDLDVSRSRVTSFLDFGPNGSSIGSDSREETQSSNDSVANQLRSRWSSTTVPSVAQETTVKRDSSGDSQSRSQSQSQSFVSFSNNSNSSPSSFPFPVSLPASPHHPEGHRPSPPRIPQGLPQLGAPSISTRPPETNNLESPTESVPMSISDLHFTHSDSEGSEPSNSSHLPRHPPLPNIDVSHESEEDMTTPTFVVARVLGMATATLAHTRVGSTGATPTIPDPPPPPRGPPDS